MTDSLIRPFNIGSNLAIALLVNDFGLEDLIGLERIVLVGLVDLLIVMLLFGAAAPSANAMVTGAMTPPKLSAAVRPAVTARRAMFLLMLIFFSSAFCSNSI